MLRLVFLLAVVAACHHNPPHKPGEDYLKDIKFEGNKKLSNKDLVTGLALHRTEKAGRPADPYLVQIDADRLRGQYGRLGYFETDIKPRVERQAEAQTVTYAIEEGQRSTTHVTITGLPKDVDLALVRSKLPLVEGAPFNYELYDGAKVDLLGVVQDAGYAHAKLDAQVYGDLATHTANVDLMFDPGPKCTFGKISIQGVDGDLKEAIENRLRFATGETFSNAAITRTQRAIYSLSRFSTVEVNFDPGQEGKSVLDMHVAVSESAAHQVTLGGGFGIDPLNYELRARAGYSVAGFPTAMDTLTLDFRPAYAYLRDGSGYEPRIRALAKVERQDLFMTYALGSVEVGYDYLAYEAYTLYGPRAQLGYEFRIAGLRHLKAKLGYRIHDYAFSHPSPAVDEALKAQLGIDHKELVGVYEQSLIADFRDHPIEPRWGVYAEMKIGEGTKLAGSDYEYQLITPELRGYVPVGPVELAARARYGAIYGKTPPTERFFAGGATSNRGFSERALSPSVTGMSTTGSTITVPYGGAGMFDSSIEARIPITTIKTMPLHGVVFFDAGDVTETPSQLQFTNLNYALGLGARLLTIVGPVRFDFGYRLNRTGATDPEPGSNFAFHLSLGEAF